MKNKVMGTLLLAEEGINGTIAGPQEGIENVLAYLKSDTRLADIEHKESYVEFMPFYRLKVRLKKEIVTIGLPEVDPTQTVGTYVGPEEWNKLLEDEDVIVLDTRNDYEFDIGTFKNALNPNTQSFREFPEYVKKNLSPKKHKKVAMFCTGGIRCEKASSYMLQQGFEEVYHLKGGILKYIEDTPQENSKWEGECFVFDNRVAVNHSLEKGKFDQCFACRYPVSEEDKKSDKYVKGISCPHCHDSLTAEKKKRFESRQQQIELAKKRNEQHIGSNYSS